MNIPIIYEDKTFLVIDKPPGIVVNRALSVSGLTIQDWSEEKLKIQKSKIKDTPEVKESVLSLESNFYNRAGIVHRLDKDTSGLLLIAKTPKTLYFLQSQFKERKIVKKYKTLVHGKVLPSEGEIKASVGRLPWNRKRFGILPGGKPSVSKYKVLNIYQREKTFFYSLLEVIPLTGRTHQIRVHLKYIGHPVVADSFYAGRKRYRLDIKFFPRIFLHASYLRFQHPESLYPSYSGLQPAGAAKQIRWVYTDAHSSKRSIKWVEFASPLPNDLQVALDRLEKMVKES